MDKRESKDFLRQNTKNANLMFMRISFCLNMLGPLFALLTCLDVFDIAYSYSVFVTICSVVMSLVLVLLNKYCKNERIAMGFSLGFFAVFVAILAVNSDVGVYISYALVSFLSCIYMDYKVTIRTCVACYLVMLASLFVRSHTAFKVFVDSPSPLHWFIAFGAGFTIEFFFVFLITQSIAKLFRSTLDKLYDKTVELQSVQDKLIFAFADTVEFSDSTTGAHIKRTSVYVKLIALKLREMGYYEHELTDELVDLYTRAAPLHDIGKISVPNNILTKPGRFTDEEFAQMKKHVQAGYELIEKEFHELEDAGFVKVASDMAYYHHEKWDGNGYPRGIKGNDIPVCGRIMAAADVLDALLSKRQYKEPFSLEQTLEIFEESRGSHFEPCIVDAVLSLKDEIAQVIRND